MNHPAILETTEAFGETTLIAEPSQIVDLCRYLKDSEKFIRLSAVTAVDWHPALMKDGARFEVVYHLHSIERNRRLRLKCRLSGNDPEIESVYADGPSPGRWTGLAGMVDATREAISVWESFRF